MSKPTILSDVLQRVHEEVEHNRRDHKKAVKAVSQNCERLREALKKRVKGR